MKHRSVHIGVLGAVMGLMIGVGSVLYGQDMTAMAVTSDGQAVSYRNFRLSDAFKRRSVSNNINNTRAKTKRIEGSPDRPKIIEEQPAPLDTDRCPVQVEIAAELRSIVLPLIPGRPVDLIVRSSITKAFDQYVADCLQYIESTVEAEPEPEASMEDVRIRDYSRCDNFTGVRRTHCIVEMRERGFDYRP
ncbi:MAG: hypothetical protein O2904_00780 [bacterium]|nr:hypothetical protein [bacterium]